MVAAQTHSGRMNLKRCHTVILAFLAWPGLVQAQIGDADKIALEVQIAELATGIEAARADAAIYATGSVQETLATVRAETLALTAAMLEARLAAEETGTPIELTLPVVAPDPEAATRIEADIAAQEAIIADAEAEAASADAENQAVASSRVEAEKLTLARLRAALMQARYGAMMPAEIAGSAFAATDVPPPETAENAPVAENPSDPPAWADPDHPEIDYNAAIFQYLAGEGYTIHGWWGLLETQAELDDSARVFGVQVEKTALSSGYSMTTPGLSIGCSAGTLSFIYDTDDYLLADVDSNGFDVTYRVDAEPTFTQRWRATAGGEAAGLFGRDTEPFLESIRDAESVFLRIVEPGGERHDETFALAGVHPVIDAAIAACASATPDLSVEDYRAIQELLNAAGFDAGKPDGIWGNGSRGAMRAFQEGKGLPATGSPDADTLEVLGFAF